MASTGARQKHKSRGAHQLDSSISQHHHRPSGFLPAFPRRVGRASLPRFIHRKSLVAGVSRSKKRAKKEREIGTVVEELPCCNLGQRRKSCFPPFPASFWNGDSVFPELQRPGRRCKLFGNISGATGTRLEMAEKRHGSRSDSRKHSKQLSLASVLSVCFIPFRPPWRLVLWTRERFIQC